MRVPVLETFDLPMDLKPVLPDGHGHDLSSVEVWLLPAFDRSSSQYVTTPDLQPSRRETEGLRCKNTLSSPV